MHPAAEPERHTIDSENAAHALHLLRAHPADRDGRAPVLLLHGSTLPGSIAYTLRFDGRSWLDDLAQRGRDVWSLDIRGRSEEHTSDLQSLMRISYAVFCLKKKKQRIK